MTVTMTQFLSPKWLCYKSSLTYPKCTKSHLQRSRFQKIFPGRNPRTPAFEGPLRGGGGSGEGGGKGKGDEGRGGEMEGMWRGPESGLPQGPRWRLAGLLAVDGWAVTFGTARRRGDWTG